MKKLAALLALSAVAAATPALSADIIEYIPPPPEPVLVVPPSWTGLYLGGQAGYAFHGSGSGLPGAFIAIPGRPGQPGRPAVPPTPFIPGTPATPGSPAVPGTPFVPGTPAIPATFGTAEFSCAAAGAGGAGAGTCAVEYSDGRAEIISYEELSAAYAAAGNAGALGVAGEVTVELTPAVPATPDQPATPGTPAVPPSPGTPDIPATPGSPAVDPIPEVPSQVISIDSLPGYSRFEDDGDGFIGGAHIGYDHQLGYSFGTGALVVGALADISYVDVDRLGGVSDGVDFISARQELDYLATLRLRAGAGFERALVYATGGLAFGEVETTIVNTLFTDAASSSDTRVGYAVGAGVEFLATENFSLGVEYLYTDLGDGDDFVRDYDFGNGSVLRVNGNDEFDFHTVWAKASFRFN